MRLLERNPKLIRRSYSMDNLAPHLQTNRWEYTVPPDRFTIIWLLELQVVRTTAAAPLGLIDLHICYTPKGEDVLPLTVAMLHDNAIGAKGERTLGTPITLWPGDYIVCHTADGSTGGGASYRCNMLGVELNLYIKERDVQEPKRMWWP